MALRSVRFASNQRLQRAAENAPPLTRGEPDRTAMSLVQEALVDLGYAMPRSTHPDGSMDGIYGSETEDIIKQFQRRHGLLGASGQPDGIAGRNTLHKLDAVAPVVPFSRTVSYDVALIAQPNTTSCWAASMAMLVSYHERRTVSAQQIADAVGLDLNSSYPWSVLRDAARVWRLQEVPMTPALSELPGLLLRHGPLWMVVTGAPTHAVVLTGSDGRRYSWNNPWPPNVGERAHLQSAASLATRFGGASPMIGSRNFQLLHR